MPSHTIHTPSILNACCSEMLEMLATASCHNAHVHAVQSDLGKGRRERKFWCALIRMKQSLFMSGFRVGISLWFLLGTGRLPQVKGRHTPTNPRMPRELRNFSRPKL